MLLVIFNLSGNKTKRGSGANQNGISSNEYQGKIPDVYACTNR